MSGMTEEVLIRFPIGVGNDNCVVGNDNCVVGDDGCVLVGDDEVVYHINLDIENVLFNIVKHR